MVKDFPKLLTMVHLDQTTQDTCKKLSADVLNGILITGMGGSAIAGLYVQGLLRETAPVPILVNQDYKLPECVDSKWVTIAVSYSGNTEETLAAFDEAIKRRSTPFVIGSGGQLHQRKKAAGKISLPKDYQPRAVFPSIFSPLLNLVECLIGSEPTQLDSIGKNLEDRAEKWVESDLSPMNMAKDLRNMIPLFIGSRQLIPVAYRAKCQINENAKTMAFFNKIPEANHNEIEGFVSDYSSEIIPIFLRSSYEDNRIRQRLDITASIYENEGYSPIRLSMQSSNIVEEMLAMTFYLDWVSTELAGLRGVDSVSVERISQLKERLK